MGPSVANSHNDDGDDDDGDDGDGDGDDVIDVFGTDYHDVIKLECICIIVIIVTMMMMMMTTISLLVLPPSLQVTLHTQVIPPRCCR